MKVLALDAAIGPFSAALDLDSVITSDRSEGNDALEAGLARVERLLDHGGVRLADIDRIAVGVGPGSFTGIRIALSFAKALAYGTGIPLVGISSYDILTPPNVNEPCLTVVSGRPGIICARLKNAEQVRFACGPTPAVLDQLLAELNRPTTLIVDREDVFRDIGEGWLCENRWISPAAHNPAVAIALLAREREPASSPHGVVPDYGEMPAVTVPKARTKTAP